jgi:hypothetical protein
VRVAHFPRAKQHAPLVGPVVAVGVLQEQRFTPVVNDHAAIREGDACRNAQALRENGEAIGQAIVVGVFTNANAVAAEIVARQVVRVIDGLGQPQPASLVPCHGDRLDDVGLRGEELDMKALGNNNATHRFIGRKRLLHSRMRIALGTPLVAGNVIGDLRANLDVLERLWAVRQFLHHRRLEGPVGRIRTCFGRVLTGGPADAAFHEVVKARLAPRMLVVSPRGVEDAAFAVPADPRPRLSLVSLDAIGEHYPIAFIVQMMDVGFIEAFETAVTSHNGMIFLDDRIAHSLPAVALELSTNQGHDRVRVAKAIGCTVKRHETAAVRYIVQERLFLIRLDAVDVGVQHERIVLRKRLDINVAHPVGVSQHNAALVQHRFELRKSLGWPVRTVIAQKQDLNFGRGVYVRSGSRVCSGCQPQSSYCS